MSAPSPSDVPAAIPVAMAVAGLVVAYAWPRRPRPSPRLRRHGETIVISTGGRPDDAVSASTRSRLAPPRTGGARASRDAPYAGSSGPSSFSPQVAADQRDVLEITREVALPELATVRLPRRLSGNPFVPLGRWLRRAARRPPNPDADRRLGIVVVAGVAAGLLVDPWLGPLVAGAVAGAQHWRRRRRDAIAEQQVADALPDVVDLLRVAVSAGCTVPVALAAVARRAPPAIAPALREAVRRHALGMSLIDALDGVIRTYGDVVRPVVQVLMAADRDGAPLGPALERLAADLRTDRRRRADIAARRLPIALLFPLVLCTLPAFGLLTLAPLLVTTLQALHH